MDLKGKTAVITGASSGIGRAAALEFARRGANLFLAARGAEQLAAVAEECRRMGVRAEPVTTDVTRPEDCARLAATAGAVDVLVNNAGFAVFDSIESAKSEDLEAMMRTNFFGAVNCTKAFLPAMLARRSGTIVNVGSIAGLMGYARMGGYCATKFALVGFSEALRDEVIGRGVRVALVCPGTTETNFFVTAERKKMPGASRLMPGARPEQVARVIAGAAEDGRYRTVMPLLASVYIKFKEIAPRLAHAMFRRVSAMLEPR